MPPRRSHERGQSQTVQHEEASRPLHYPTTFCIILSPESLPSVKVLGCSRFLIGLSFAVSLRRVGVEERKNAPVTLRSVMQFLRFWRGLLVSRSGRSLILVMEQLL